MKRCPECGTPLGMVPLKLDCRTHKLMAGLENMQEKLDAQEAREAVRAWREGRGGPISDAWFDWQRDLEQD